MTGSCARLLSLAAALLVAGAAVAFTASSASAAGSRITLDRLEVAPGEPVLVTLSGFGAPYVNVVLCGNLAKRGATDCNVRAGVSEEIGTEVRPTLTRLVAHPPPVPCPCVVRASDRSGEEFAVAPIVLVGHPEAPVVGADRGPLVELTVEAGRSSGGVVGALRSALGGPTKFAVEVSVRNVTTETLSKVALRGSASHRFNDDAAVLDLDAPGPIDPGQTWTTQVEVEVPAPAIGRYAFEVTASGAGETVVAEHGVGNTPMLLLLLVALFVADVTAMLLRVGKSRRRHVRGTHAVAPTG